jgi:predicted metalloprotease with PDZ domain
MRHILRLAIGSVLLVLLKAPFAAAADAIALEVDARQASRGLQTVRLAIPVQAGPLTLLYPKWIPGNHRPSGPVNSLAGLQVSAAGKPIPWQRDAVDMFAFHVDVPAGVSTLDVGFELLASLGAQAPTSDRKATDALLVLQWNRLVLYPAGVPADQISFRASLRLPEGWQHASALRTESAAGGKLAFAPVPLTTLIDSPVLAGRHFRRIELGGEPAVRLNIAADSEAALAIMPAAEQGFRNLVSEARALFGAVHYGGYDFLLSLTDQADSSGLEHHESSDNWVAERSLVDPDAFRAMASLLPHEYSHSWNGKYRRPAGIATPDFNVTVQPDLLWVYEGLTEYLQQVLSARSGVYSRQEYLDDWAYSAAEMELHKGREWRSLQDTARAVQLMRGQPQDWLSRRRGVDYYTEGALLWLEADVLIRRLSKGKRSLDDFCRTFHGGTSSGPAVVSYSFDDVVQALNAVQPFDWAEFWRERLERTRPGAPVEGIEGGGWKLVYADEPTVMQKAYDAAGKRIDLRHSLGFALGAEDGVIADVIPGSAADAAALAPGSVLVAVNGRKWSRALLDDALRASAAAPVAIALLVQNDDVFSTRVLQYQGGARYPRLARIEGARDVLADIARPRAGSHR